MEASNFYAAPGAMTTLPDHPALAGVPRDLDVLRRVVQGVLVHRDWVQAYGIAEGDVRIEEQHLRSTAEVLRRALELDDRPITTRREPVARVQGICRHFTLLHTALLRWHGIPARVRCGFSNYFDRSTWYDHWITERWDNDRWVRDDPQIDDFQRAFVKLDIDPYDQPPGNFLSGNEAWTLARAGEVDPALFGIFDMWGLGFIAGNVISDFACINKVELLPWDGWGMMTGPYEPPDADATAVLDDVSKLVSTDDFDEIRARYESDDRLRVPTHITSFIDGAMVDVHLDLGD